MERLLQRIARRLCRAILAPRRWVARRVEGTSAPLIRLGSHYGGWTLVDQGAIANAVNLLCGAGEDVSFDMALQQRYGGQVVIVDPTPRAVRHWAELASAAEARRPYFINRSPNVYQVDEVDFGKVDFLPYAIWTSDTEVTFWAPADVAHVSHSIVNLQGTRNSIRVEAKTVASLLAHVGSALPLGVLKLDIEGAAINVLEALMASELRPLQILAEFEELTVPTPKSFARLKALIARLEDGGYRIVAFDGHANVTFWRP